jgi:hypothetical protein
MKCFINNHDLLTWPKAMAEKMVSQGHEPIFCDNGSTYTPLLDWYRDCPYHVEMMSNFGQHGVWQGASRLLRGLDFYAVSDPDMGMDEMPDDWADVMTEEVKRTGEKAGPSLRDDRIPLDSSGWSDDGFYEHPEGYRPDWFGDHIRQRRYGKVDFFQYHIDTTLAVYGKNCNKGIFGTRADRPYWVRHLPWHIVLDKREDDTLQIVLDDELYYYFRHASGASCTKARMMVMLELYRDRLEEGGNG